MTRMSNNKQVLRRRRFVPRACRWFGVVACLLAAPVHAAFAQNDDAARDPVALVRRASQNELKASNGNHPYRYQLHKIDDGKITTKEIVETKDGDVARLIAVNDKPLDPDAEKAEIARLDNLAAHPELQKHRRQKEQEDSDRANKMVRLLPDAFVYKFE